MLAEDNKKLDTEFGEMHIINIGKDGKDGKDGETPYIKGGYWWIGETNTNVKAGGITAVETAAEMDAILANATDATVGTHYMYIGASTDKYENGAVYEIEASEV